jgi:error-prone DNA polymerase
MSDLPTPPSRDFGTSLQALRASPGARKEAARRRNYPVVRGAPKRSVPYAELHVASAFSFLDGASLPEDLVERAAELELPAVALADRNGLYGTPRFHKAGREGGIKAIVGAELVFNFKNNSNSSGKEDNNNGSSKGTNNNGPSDGGPARSAPGASEHGAQAPRAEGPDPQRRAGGRGESDWTPGSAPRLTLLVASRTGYRNLCKLLTAAARGRPKGEAFADWRLLEEHGNGLHVLTGGDEGPLARLLEDEGVEAAQGFLARLAHLFPGRLHVELQRHLDRGQEGRNEGLVELARRLRLPLVATNGVRYATARDQPLHDVLTCIRSHTHLDAAGRLLAPHRERHLKGPAEMAALFPDRLEAVAESAALAVRLDFTLADLGYRFPDVALPPGETAITHLSQLTWNEARVRFRPLTARAQDQIAKELALIGKLDLAGYFLIVRDIVQFCKREGILVQGRGSAANSAVCYALSITAVDPVKMDLLFERFLSEERGEWPDIDLDLPSGDQREKVIQYVYRRYGTHGAAMTANVITYRDRSAAREVAKALGYNAEQVDRLAKQLGRWHYDVARGDPKSMAAELAAAGFDPAERRLQLFVDLWRRIQNLPRHLGQHSGGMVLAAGRLDEVVPLEPAAMEGRVVVQWDKDDCADLGIIKVDLLGLGMLQALEEAIPLIRERERIDVDLAHLPPEDPATYEMLRRADTVGVFQVESRAQMASLPRNAPVTFYDLVVQVAIIRPGPIVGGMVHPYFERRRGRESVTYPHPCLEPILARTLGVPLFQEQILRIAMVAAGLSGGEAEELRRAMGFKRSVERMEAIEAKLRRGMAARGITGATQDAIVKAITSFALYGFPESHAASFALIAYASAYLKAHHPTAFLISLLNAWPMGFYHPATLVKDAQRHGVEVRPIDVNFSGWECGWEEREAETETTAGSRSVAGACRLGLRYVTGLRQTAAEAIATEQHRAPFRDADELARRCRLRADELATLAEIGALASLGLTRRQALWQAARAVRPAGELFAGLPGESGHEPPEASPLLEMTAFEETLADYAGTQLTTGPHPLAHLRPALDRHRVVPAARLADLAHGTRVRTAGAVTVRQRPGTAKGVLFLTLEDETGMSQAIVSPELLQRERQLLVGAAGLVVEGVLLQRDGSLSVRAERFWRLGDVAAAPSHDFR